MPRKRQEINVRKIIATHPVTGEPIDLKWYRGANRYNNGGARFGNQYMLRYVVAYAKAQPYTEEQLNEYREKQQGLE